MTTVIRNTSRRRVSVHFLLRMILTRVDYATNRFPSSRKRYVRNGTNEMTQWHIEEDMNSRRKVRI